MLKKSKATADHTFSRFLKADAPPKPRLIGASFGEPGTGKTHFWLGAPGPIVVFSFDKGMEGVVEKHQEHKDIYVAEYDWAPTGELTQDDAVALRNQFIDDYTSALAHARTVVIDKETDLWELFRYAEFGGPNDAPRNYPELNQRYRKYINMPKALDLNFGVVQSVKDEWISKFNPKTGTKQGQNTGNRIRAGFSEIEGLVHQNFWHQRVDGTFKIEVGKARGPSSVDVQDQTFENLSFVELAQLIFPDSSENDWQ